jgi:phytoene synthase
VGLVCIRIFGYQDPRAEKLAEETGIAFQLTNILRDVAEDAGRNRSTSRSKISPPTMSHWILCCIAKQPLRQQKTSARCWREIGQRAEVITKSAQELMPLIDQRKPAGAVGAGHGSIMSCSSNRARRLRCFFAPCQRADV